MGDELHDQSRKVEADLYIENLIVGGQQAEEPAQLPIAPPEQLFGRDAQVSQVNAALDAGRARLLHGLGGMGKTAIAAWVAADRLRRARHPGGVLWISAYEADLAALCDQVGRIYKDDAIPRTPDLPAKTALVRALLGARRPLIVLDDARDPAAAHEFARQCAAGLPLLLTSREKMPGAWGYLPVEELPDADAQNLFRHHAGDAACADADDVAALCRALGWHAMALEIAGQMARVDGLTCAEVLAALGEAGEHVKRLEWPTADKAARPGLRASFLASYGRLSDDEAAALRAFGALWAPTATPYVIGRVAMLKNEDLAEEALRRLARRSLTRREATPDGVTRYRAHDLTRDFARALLRERAELPDAEARALAACVAYAQRHAEENRAAHDRLDAELDNLLAAAEYAAARGVGRR